MKPRIFISAVTREFGSTRQRVANILTRLGYEPVWQEALEGFVWFLFDQSVLAETHGTLSGALGFSKEALQLAEHHAGITPADSAALEALTAALNQQGDVLVLRGMPGDAEKALGHFERSLEVRERLLLANPDSAQAARDVFASHFKLFQFHQRRGAESPGTEHLEKCFAILDSSARDGWPAAAGRTRTLTSSLASSFTMRHFAYRNMPLHPLLDEPVSDPLPLFRYRDGIAAVDLLGAAIAHLDFFTWLADHPSTPGAVCAHFGIHARPADVMLTLFNAMGLVTQSGGVFHLTLRAREHLAATSPWNLAPYFASMKDRPQTLDMLKVLRTGKPANWGSYDAQAWAQAMERPDFAASFTAAMDCRGVLLGPAMAKRLDLAGRKALLDVAGGSGIYACAVVARHPHLRAAVMEKPPVDRIARECIEKQSCAGKVEVITQDMFTGAWPGGFDVHLISNVLHDWDEPTVRDLLEKSHAALPTGGLLLIHDAFINADKTGPLHIAEYSALLMQITEGKCYSLREMRGCLGSTGFEWVDHQPSAVGRSVIVARRV